MAVFRIGAAVGGKEIAGIRIFLHSTVFGEESLLNIGLHACLSFCASTILSLIVGGAQSEVRVPVAVDSGKGILHKSEFIHDSFIIYTF